MQPQAKVRSSIFSKANPVPANLLTIGDLDRRTGLSVSAIRDQLNAKIHTLQQTRDRLDGCIGCGCLSLETCALYNPADRASRAGPGPRYLLGNSAQDFEAPAA
jgi:hypothetical protein